jgi:ABC-type tungstate transport system substrate-binding protein
MHLPSFLWLWKIAAWSMGLSLVAYLFLAMTGIWMLKIRNNHKSFGLLLPWHHHQVRSLHYIIGIIMVSLVLLLLAVGIVGTLGHFGSLGHSPHLIAGLIVVILTLVSAFSATQINTENPWAKPVHISCNICLFLGFTWVSLTGWSVVQKYLP